MRLYKPDNATVLKGALRNLLDGSRTTSIKHFVFNIETIHHNFFDDYDAYNMNSFLPLYKQGATLVLYNQDYQLLTSRGPDTDFIIVKGSTVKAYDTGAGLEVFTIENYEANPNDLCDVENFLDSFWRYLSVGWNRSDYDGYRFAAVMAFDDNGNFLLPPELYDRVYEGDIVDAGFSFEREESIGNIKNHAVNSNTQSVNTQTTENKGKNTMTKIANIVAANKSAAVNAAKLEAGKIALTQITKVAAKKAPFMIKGYIDTPIGRVVIANLLGVAVDQYAPSNQKAKAVAGAAMEAAMLEMVQSFNIAEMIDEMVKGIDISTFTTSTESE